MMSKCQKCRSISLHEYMYKDVYHAHHLSFIGIQGGSKSKLLYVYDTQLIIDDALLQAMPDINHTLIQCFAVMKFCLVHWLPHF